MAEAKATDNWTEYENERELEERRRRERLWQELRDREDLPAPELLRSLSGLLEADVQDLRGRWPDLRLELRRALVHALGDLADADFKLDFSAVFRVALDDDDAEIRATSVLGLREVEDVRLIPVLTRILRHDPAGAARAAAATALGDYVLLGELGKVRPELFEATVAALRATYLDEGEEAEVQRQALEAVAYTAEGGVAELIRDAYDAASEAMKISAVFAMGRSADTRWSTIIQHELTSTNPTMRMEATRASGELQLREAAREVASLTDDVDQSVRLTALWALGQIGGTVARKTLGEFVTSADPELRAVATEALQELEFFHGDPASFFGPPSDFSGDAEEPWEIADLFETMADDEDDDEDDEDWD